jgi:hypothetical protein
MKRFRLAKGSPGAEVPWQLPPVGRPPRFAAAGRILLGVLIALLTAAGIAAAMDPEGCLFCHGYPGLVTLHETGKPKMLHIDEKSYARSVHGKLACRQCHPAIQQVPHTGVTEVSCSSRCHPEERYRQKAGTAGFENEHEGQQSAIVRLDDPSSCRVCHPLYPHRGNPRDRAFLNMHTGFMICEVCHLEKASFDRVVYGWMYTENAVFKGKPYGTFYDPGLKTGRSEHFISRIAPYEMRGEEKRLLMNTWDTEKAVAYKASPPADRSARDRELSAFHRQVHRRDLSVACNECHVRDGMLDLKALGFSKNEIDNLTQLNIKGLVTKYKTFYFPHLFD